MKKFLAVFILCAAFSAQASLEAHLRNQEIGNNQSYFETLGDLFKKGEAPEIEQISNRVWSGRCFEKDQPSTPLNGAYVLRRAVNSDVGPIGDRNISYEVASVWSKSSNANYYDEMRLSDFNSQYGRNYRLVVISHAIIIKLDSNVISTVKRSGDYLVEELSEKTVFTRCYYFKSKRN
jgi:hypothetical protein